MSPLYVGLMSGTSVDGVDAVIVAIRSEDAPDQRFGLLATHMEPIPARVASRVRELMHPASDGLDELGWLDQELGALFARVALKVVAKAGRKPTEVCAIGSHGQTVRHRPNGGRGFTIQIGNPSVIAEVTGIATVAEFRARDMAAGGQGAPLVPAFHRWLFHSPTRNRAIVNIGGIANITHITTSGPVTGFDTGPGNTLLDQWIQRHRGAKHDDQGNWAAGGKTFKPLLQRLLGDPYFKQPHPKSTGREQFNLDWLDAALADLKTPIAPQDVQATLVELTARTIAKGLEGIAERTDEMYICGGGSHNAALIRSLKRHISDIPIETTESLGLHPDWVEACAFAWLAHRRLEGLPGNIPNVTGARHSVVLGGVYAGTGTRPDPTHTENKKGG